MKKVKLEPNAFGYKFQYPVAIFTEKNVPASLTKQAIIAALKGRNPYYILFPSRRKLLVERIHSLHLIRKFIDSVTEEMFPNADVVSIYTCGSYIYSHKHYTSTDIDIGVVLEGSMFKYIPNIQIPYILSKKLRTTVKYLSVNFYGRDNFERGVSFGRKKIEQDMEVMREASVGYLRNVTIHGKDFLPVSNRQNVLAAKLEMLTRYHLRLIEHGRYREESEGERLEKLACRMHSLSVFLKFLDPSALANLEEASYLPVLAQQNRFRYREARSWYNKIAQRYKKLKKTYEGNRG